MVQDQRVGAGAEAVGIDVGEVADVVAVGLEPADHRILGVKELVMDICLGSVPTAVQGAVVAHRVGVPWYPGPVPV